MEKRGDIPGSGGGRPAQLFNTPGIEPLRRPTIALRAGMAIIRWVERLNMRFSNTGNPCIYDAGMFPWAADIEREWLIIRRELDGVLAHKDELPNVQDVSPDVASISKDQAWKTFILSAYGLTCARNIACCPDTWRILQKVPGLKTAMFSIFEPGKHLPAHRGPYNGLLCLHLGLIVPEPRQKAAIRVGGEIRHWEEGRALIFDGAYEHEAWNRTGGMRAVLFVDFVKPVRFPANILNWLILNFAVFTPFVQEGHANHRAWERAFYDEGP